MLPRSENEEYIHCCRLAKRNKIDVCIFAFQRPATMACLCNNLIEFQNTNINPFKAHYDRRPACILHTHTQNTRIIWAQTSSTTSIALALYAFCSNRMLWGHFPSLSLLCVSWVTITCAISGIACCSSIRPCPSNWWNGFAQLKRTHCAELTAHRRSEMRNIYWSGYHGSSILIHPFIPLENAN